MERGAGSPAIGVILPTMVAPGELLPDLVRTARHAEELGFESAWAVDQLVAGTGVPFVDSTVALAVAAGATRRINLAYGVMILPLRPVAWAAKQVGSLQQASGGRVLLGVGIGGDRHARSWGVPVPPLIIGGMADAALRRTARYGDGWFAIPLPPDQLQPSLDRLAEFAAEYGRPTPRLTASMSIAIEGDPALPDRAGLVRRLSDPDGMYGMPEDAVPDILVSGGPDAVADRIAGLQAIGAERVVATLAAGDWFRQADLLAEAVRRLD